MSFANAVSEGSTVQQAAVDVVSLLPRNELDVDLEQMDAVPSGPEVNIVDDFELVKSGIPVVSLGDKDSKLTFFTNCMLPSLVLHFWTCERFFSCALVLVDDLRIKRTFHMSNKRSIITVDNNNVCSIPMENGQGWQRINLDLNMLLENAFGTKFISCYEVQVTGTCKLARLFFQGHDYADNELPRFLRVCTSG
jgi:hypothetical protein